MQFVRCVRYVGRAVPKDTIIRIWRYNRSKNCWPWPNGRMSIKRIQQPANRSTYQCCAHRVWPSSIVHRKMFTLIEATHFQTAVQSTGTEWHSEWVNVEWERISTIEYIEWELTIFNTHRTRKFSTTSTELFGSFAVRTTKIVGKMAMVQENVQKRNMKCEVERKHQNQIRNRAWEKIKN